MRRVLSPRSQARVGATGKGVPVRYEGDRHGAGPYRRPGRGSPASGAAWLAAGGSTSSPFSSRVSPSAGCPSATTSVEARRTGSQWPSEAGCTLTDGGTSPTLHSFWVCRQHRCPGAANPGTGRCHQFTCGLIASSGQRCISAGRSLVLTRTSRRGCRQSSVVSALTVSSRVCVRCRTRSSVGAVPSSTRSAVVREGSTCRSWAARLCSR